MLSYFSRTDTSWGCGFGRWRSLVLRPNTASSILAFTADPANAWCFTTTERGKGDHRRYGEREEPYDFKDVETLRPDFLADVRRVRGDGS
jgi:hypothetical protein